MSGPAHRGVGGRSAGDVGELAESTTRNLEAERAFLGGIFVVGDVDLLRATVDYLAAPRHRRTAQAMLAVADDGLPVELLAVKAELRKRGNLDEVGGEQYLAELVAGTPQSTNVRHYAEQLRRLAWRRDVLARASGLSSAILSGATDRDVTELLEGLAEDRPPSRAATAAQDLYGPDVTPTSAKWRVANLIPHAGIVLVWAQPSGGKTYLLLRLSHELITGAQHLFGHPKLNITESHRRVLWICTEEDAGRLRARADEVSKGLGRPERQGEILHLFAATPGRSLTLDDLPEILERNGPLDVVVLDSLTGLRPKVVDGQRVRWDVDNDAANRYCLLLRELAYKHQVAIVLVHHTGREVSKGYRGPTDWWASADVMFGLEPDKQAGTVVVKPEKCRDGLLLPPWILRPTWGPDGFRVEFEGEASGAPAKLKGRALEVARFIETHGSCPQSRIFEEVGGVRSTLQEAIKRVVQAGQARWTGRTESRSPVVEWVETVEEDEVPK